MADLIGPMEARLLALERRQARLDGDLRGLRRELIGLGQGTWDAWSDVKRGTGVAAAPATHAVSIGGCGAVNLPDALPYTDDLYGNGTLTWDGTSAWTRCASGLSFPGGITFALHYHFDGATGLTVSYKGDGAFRPVASSCSDATNVNGLTPTGGTLVCSPYSQQYSVSSSAALAIRTLYQAGATRHLSVGPP